MHSLNPSTVSVLQPVLSILFLAFILGAILLRRHNQKHPLPAEAGRLTQDDFFSVLADGQASWSVIQQRLANLGHATDLLSEDNIKSHLQLLISDGQVRMTDFKGYQSYSLIPSETPRRADVSLHEMRSRRRVVDGVTVS